MTSEPQPGGLDDEAARREAEDARREAEALRRDRERADRAAEKEADKARRDREKLERQAAKDADRQQRDAERRERDRQKTEAETQSRAREVQKNAEAREREARKNEEQAQREREREARDAAKEAGRAMREAAKASRDAALAEQRAQREAERALAQARRAEPDAVDEAAAPVDLPPELAVLWRRPAPPRRGPRPGLTLEQIADAAIALADDEGLDAVSMARLAESLGFTTMSLYRYVASKDEVLALMSDRVGGRPVPVGPEAGDWRARLEVLLEQMRPVLRAHPWMSRTSSVLFAVGPNRLAWMEAMLEALEDTPLSEAQKLQAIGVLASHQLEFARQVDADQTRRRAVARTRGHDAPDADEHPSAVVARLLDATEHPALRRAAAGGAFDQPPSGDGPDGDALDFGTTLVLDGIAHLVASAGS